LPIPGSFFYDVEKNRTQTNTDKHGVIRKKFRVDPC